LTFLVDANVVIYAGVASEYRTPCLGLLSAVASGSADGRTSTAVLEEVWHVELSGKAGSIAGLTSWAYTVFAPLLPVTDETFRLALSLDARSLGANDRLHVATCLVHSLDAIVSADAGLDEIRGIRRVDPLDARSLRRLLGSQG
jgi:predicted nucleic acid-binding protein